MRRFLKISVTVLASLVFLVLLIVSSLESEAVQGRLRSYVGRSLSEMLDTRVSVGRIGWDPVHGFRVQDAFIRDQEGDTLFFIGETQARLQLYDGKRHQVFLHSVSLDRVLVNFRQYAGKEEFNFDFFIDALDGGPRDTTRAPVIWTMLFHELELHQADFHFRVDDDTVSGRSFRENDFRFNGIDARLSDFYIIDDSLNFVVEGMKFKEQNSFEITRLDAHAIICSKGMLFSDLLLETPHSVLKNYFGMEYEHWRAFNNFESEVVMKTNLRDSRVSFADIRLFSDELSDWNQVFTITGDGEGPLNRIKARNLNIHYGQLTQLRGDVTLRGLPDIEQTFVEASLSTAESNSRELGEMLVLDGLPKELERLGLIRFNGQFTGFLYDFVAYGDFNTALGFVRSDLNMKLEGGIPEYSGSLEAVKFDLGRLADVQGIGKISFAGEVNGKGFDLEEMETRIKADIGQFQMAGYDYRQLKVNGLIREQVFEGNLQTNDPNLVLNFNGKVRLNEKEPEIHGVGKLYRAELARLNWAPEFEAAIAADVDMDFSGSDLDDLEGSVAIRHFELEKEGKVYRVDSLVMRSEQLMDWRTITVRSDLFDVDMQGRFLPSQLGKSFNNFFAQLLPNTLQLERVPLENESFRFAVDLRRTREFTELFEPGFWVSDGQIGGSYDANTRSLRFSLAMDKVHLDEFEFHNLNINADTSIGDERFALEAGCLEIFRHDSSFAHGTSLELEVEKNLVGFKVSAFSDPYGTNLDLNGQLQFSDSGMFTVFEPSGIQVDTALWEIGDHSGFAILNGGRVRFDSFELGFEHQFVRINGGIEKDLQSTLSLDFNLFDLSVINRFAFQGGGTSVQGVADGNIHITSLEGAIPLFTSNLRVDSLGVNHERLGDLSLQARVPKGYELITVNGILRNGYAERLKLEGFVRTAKTDPSYNLQLSIDTTPLVVLQPFLVDLVSDIEGKGFGKLVLSGKLKEPDLKGNFHMLDAGMRVDYLNTRYRFNNVIRFSSKRIDLQRFAVTDQEGNKGYCSGFIDHDFFSDLDMHIELSQMRNFLCLNTGKQDNEYYYGRALLTGSARFEGSPDNMVIDVKGRAEKGSSLFVPLEKSSGSSELEFIRFVDFDSYGEYQPYQDLSGIQLNFDLEITPSTEIQLIFDSRLGDIIRARGYSNLKMEINSNGDFRMYGEYEVVEGDYLFTAVNLINKKFVIDPGGKIVWNGDPMKANLNIDAVYQTKASPENLMRGVVSEDELANFRQRTTVEAIMKLRGELTSPEVRFGLRLPDMSSITSSGTNVNTLQTVVRRIETDQEEMTRQVFSLLAANTFIPPAVNQQYVTGGTGVESGLISSSVGDLLSNQITNWLSGINANWNLGVNYVLGNQSSAMIFNLSKKFFDDRLEIEGSLSTNSSFYNNISAMYRITPDGRVRVRAFNRTGNLPSTDPSQTGVNTINRNINTQGVGIYYRIEFDYLTGDRRKLRKELKEQKKASEKDQNP